MALELSCAIKQPAGFPTQLEIAKSLDLILNKICELDEIINHFDLDLLLVDDSRIKQINYETRNKNQVTDVLSFPLLPFEVGPGTSNIHLNNKSLNKKPTSIIHLLDWSLSDMFPPTIEGSILLGDLVISIPTCLKQSQEIGHSIKDEFFRLFVHGILHLFGYDHETSSLDKKNMESREDLLLLHLDQSKIL